MVSVTSHLCFANPVFDPSDYEAALMYSFDVKRTFSFVKAMECRWGHRCGVEYYKRLSWLGPLCGV